MTPLPSCGDALGESACGGACRRRDATALLEREAPRPAGSDARRRWPRRTRVAALPSGQVLLEEHLSCSAELRHGARGPA